MLELILGISGTGKTARVLAKMKARAAAGRAGILLVPEQFSSSAETMVYRALGDRLGARAEVYSFTSFAEQVLKTFGGVAAATLTDAARAVAVRRAMDALGDEARLYRSQRRSTGFCSLAAQAILELKTAGAAPEHLLEAARKAGADGEKLRELGLLYAAYEAVIAGSAMDPSDRLEAAAARLETGWLADKAVFIDNFDGFTAPQYRLLEKLVQAEACVVTLCCDTLADREAGLGLFSPVRQTARRLERLARRAGVGLAAPVTLEEDLRHKDAPALRAVNLALAGAGQPAQPERPAADGPAFFLTPANGLYDECKRVACRIAALARSGVRYGEMAVVCRLMDGYREALRSEFAMAGIPCFADEADTLEHTAPVAFCSAALTLLARGLATEPLLRLLKTDLCGYGEQAIAALENYAYTWQPRTADWRAPFARNPAGFGAQMRPEDAAALAAAEAVRRDAVGKVEAFLQAARGRTAAGISKQLYLLLEAFGADRHTLDAAARLEQAGDAARAEAVCRAWNTLMDLLGQMERLLGEDEVTAAEYGELFLLLVRSTDLGRVPQTQDAVILTTADRMRLDGPRVCFVVGAEEGNFPKLAGASGLLTHADRELLVAGGVQMPGSFENRTLLEQMFFYRAMTAPAERLYVSYTAPEAGGGAPTSALAPVAALAAGPDELAPAQWAPTPAAALDVYGEHYREDTPAAAALAGALAQAGRADPSLAASLAAMDAAARPAPFAAADKAGLAALLGSRLSLSPTRVEQYYRCRFSYFLQYVLRIRPRRRAQLSPMESGSLIHYILEQAMRRAGEAFPTMDKEELAALAGQIADGYVQENMPDASARFAYLIRRLKASVTRLLYYLQAEQAQSSFRPAAYEQPIGEGGVPPLTVCTPDGHTVQVVGQIDRVDVMHRGGKDYVRVVDYKTGTKTFSLEEVYCGLNTQMLLYLFTLCHAPGAIAGIDNPVAAGVLYLAGDPPPRTAGRSEARDTPAYRVDGLVLDDEVVLRGMDKEAAGLFVPVTFGKDGRPRASAKLASLEKLGSIERHITGLVVEMARGLYGGDVAAAPLRTAVHSPCDACDYRAVCRHEDGVGERFVAAPRHVFEPGSEEPPAHQGPAGQA